MKKFQKKELSQMQNSERLRQLFRFGFKKNTQDKALKIGKREHNKKRLVKILVFLRCFVVMNCAKMRSE